MKNRKDNDFEKRLDSLSFALAKMRNAENIREFLEDLCTPSELIALADRWEVAIQLEKGQSYREIQSQAEVSTTTVTRVGRCMKYGEGYRLALKQMNGAAK